jgi:hypothetical protein
MRHYSSRLFLIATLLGMTAVMQAQEQSILPRKNEAWELLLKSMERGYEANSDAIHRDFGPTQFGVVWHGDSRAETVVSVISQGIIVVKDVDGRIVVKPTVGHSLPPRWIAIEIYPYEAENPNRLLVGYSTIKDSVTVSTIITVGSMNVSVIGLFSSDELLPAWQSVMNSIFKQGGN